MTKFAAPESGPEAYIPLSGERSSRNAQILLEAARRLETDDNEDTQE